MASSSCALPEDQSLCPICLEVFNCPVTNPCGHTFCTHCLTSYWEETEGEFECPVCKEPFQNGPGFEADTFISGLASHFKSLQVTEAHTLSSDQQQVSPGTLDLDDFPPVKQKTMPAAVSPPSSSSKTSPPLLEILVFRSWTPIDVSDAASMLPDPLESGKAFAAAFLAFCREFRPTGGDIRHLMAKKLKASDITKVSTKLPQPNLRLSNPDWDSDDNVEYRNAIRRLADACTQQFRCKVDLLRVYACKQKPDETVDDYMNRVCDEVAEYGGYERPDCNEGTDKGTCWEWMCCDVIVKGLQDHLAEVVRVICAGKKDPPRLHQVRGYAQYAQERVKFEKANMKIEDRHRAAMNICMSMGSYPSRRRPFPNVKDVCYLCGQRGHWSMECPRIKT